MKVYYVYILQCSDKSFYTGITSDLERRFQEHSAGHDSNSYTHTRRPVELRWFAEFTDPNHAIDMEKKIKGWSRRKKEALIAEDWEKLVRYSRNYRQFGKQED